MRSTTALLSFVAGAAALQGHRGSSSRVLQLRDVSTCEEAYGFGWTGCNAGSFAGCYNPDLGQTCCATDGGHCQAGSYCAPVAGHCCPEDQSLQECGRARGFEVDEQPGSFDHNSTTTVTITITRTKTSTPSEKPWTTLWDNTGDVEPTVDLEAHPVEPTTVDLQAHPMTTSIRGELAQIDDIQAHSMTPEPSEPTATLQTIIRWGSTTINICALPSGWPTILIPKCPYTATQTVGDTNSKIKHSHAVTETSSIVRRPTPVIWHVEASSNEAPESMVKMHPPATETHDESISHHQTSSAVETQTKFTMDVPGYSTTNRSDPVPTLPPYVSQGIRQGAAWSLACAIIVAVLAFW